MGNKRWNRNTREQLGIETELSRGVAHPSAIVSLTGNTKSGKTVLCRTVLGTRHYVWIEGGQIKAEQDLWDRVCYELNFPLEISKTTGQQSGTTIAGSVEASAGTGLLAALKAVISASGSHLSNDETQRTYRIDSTSSALNHLLAKNIALVIDDFHYIPPGDRQAIIRSIRGAIFEGQKVILLSVSYRAFEAIRAEPEITGRLRHVEVPEWSKEDLQLIAVKGFAALNIKCPVRIIQSFAMEANGSPLLMQNFCWEICNDLDFDTTLEDEGHIPPDTDIKRIFMRVARDSGQPIYEKLAAGPVTRTARMGRPLRGGGTVDIYQALLLAIANTGPLPSISYDVIRTNLGTILADKVPQKIEVSNSLIHLVKIGETASLGEKPIEWDEDTRTLHISDPYLRFYLKWHIREQN